MKVQEFLDQLNGWSRIGLIAYVLWIFFWTTIAIPTSRIGTPFMTRDSLLDGGDWYFLWGKFIAVIFFPLVIWNGRRLYAWIKEGFNKGKTP
jgi:hypothetical protein